MAHHPDLFPPSDSPGEPGNPSGEPSSPSDGPAGDRGGRFGELLQPGARVLWFEIVSVLGSDALGPVYLARDRDGEDDGADLTVLHQLTRPEGEASESAADRPASLRAAQRRRVIGQLAERLCALRHPGAERARFARSENGSLWLVTDHVQGLRLDAWLERPEPLDERGVLDLVLPLIDALHAAHHLGLAHGAVSPGAIRVRRNGTGVLLGIATRLDAAVEQSREPDASARPYLAPERPPAPARSATVAEDVYGMGAVLYRLTTGRVPVSGTSRVMNERDPLTPAVEAGNGRFSGRLLAAVDDALAREPADRPVDMMALRRALLGNAVAARPVDTGEAATPVLAHHRSPPRLAVILSSIVLVVLVLSATRVAWRTGLLTDAANVVFGPQVSEPAPAPTPVRPMVGPMPENRAVPAVLRHEAMLASAERAFEAQRFTTPPGDNAFDRYLQVLAEDPASEPALTGVNRILGFYTSRAQRAERDGNAERAATLWARASAVARTTLSEVTLNPGARLWLESELRRVQSRGGTVSLTGEGASGAQARLMARVRRLLADAAAAEREGRSVRALELYQTVLDLVPGEARAATALERLGVSTLRSAN